MAECISLLTAFKFMFAAKPLNMSAIDLAFSLQIQIANSKAFASFLVI